MVCHFLNWHTPKKESTSILAHREASFSNSGHLLSGTMGYDRSPPLSPPQLLCYDYRSSNHPPWSSQCPPTLRPSRSFGRWGRTTATMPLIILLDSVPLPMLDPLLRPLRMKQNPSASTDARVYYLSRRGSHAFPGYWNWFWLHR